jgi:uncharacterized protein
MPFHLGILADTHGRTVLARRAVDLFVEKKIDYFLHCGDVGDFSYDGTKVLEILLPLKGGFVFGNNDYDRKQLRQFAQTHGLDCLDEAGMIERAGKKIGITHGDLDRHIHRFTFPDPTVDYLLTGHSHIKKDQKFGRLRSINPGALHRTSQPSVAILELETDDLAFFDVGP